MLIPPVFWVVEAGRCAAGPLGAAAVVGAAVWSYARRRVVPFTHGGRGAVVVEGSGPHCRRRPAAGAICFVGRCTGSRWTYAAPPAGRLPLLGDGCALSGSLPGSCCVLLPMSARRVVAAAGLAPAAAGAVGLAGGQWSVRSHRTAAAWAKSSKERTQSGKSFGPALSAYLATLVLPVG